MNAYNEHLNKVSAFNSAKSEAERVDRVYSTAGEDLQAAFSATDAAVWTLTAADIVGEGMVAYTGVQVATARSKLHAQADELFAKADKLLDEIRSNPNRYIKPRWRFVPFFKKLDREALRADLKAAYGLRRQAASVLAEADSLKVSKWGRYASRAGRVLGPLALGLGVYSDWQDGETGTQIAVSQGVSTAVGAAAGFGATVGTAALVGAAMGSVVPGAGTVVGAVVGTVVGAGVAIFSDGMIDSFLENGPDVGKALSEGWESITDTGEAIGDAVSSVGSAIGGWFD